MTEDFIRLDLDFLERQLNTMDLKKGNSSKDLPDEDELIQQDDLSEEGPVCLRFRIKRSRAKMRLDKYLHGRFPHFSRTAFQRLIKEGAVKVGGRPVKPSYEIQPGDELEVILPPLEEKELTPEPIPIDVIYEDKYFVAINKPKNMVVHPAPGYPSGTLVNAVLYYCQNRLSCSSDRIRPGVVHRLDKDTTGVIIFAKDDEAHWRLAMQFERRQVYKEYVAVVEGIIELDADIIDAPIGHHPYVREKYAVRKDVGKPAVTLYEVIERFDGFSYVKLIPKTGRTHQLRVHMSYLGYPIVSDRLYGARLIRKGELLGTDEPSPIIDRYALHARLLSFRHPITGKDIVIEAPLPSDMQDLLDLIRKNRPR